MFPVLTLYHIIEVHSTDVIVKIAHISLRLLSSVIELLTLVFCFFMFVCFYVTQ